MGSAYLLLEVHKVLLELVQFLQVLQSPRRVQLDQPSLRSQRTHQYCGVTTPAQCSVVYSYVTACARTVCIYGI